MPSPQAFLRCLLPALASFVLSMPSTAQADEDSGLAWGALAGEASIATVLALNFLVDDWPHEGPAFAVNFLPMLAIPGVGIPAHYTGLDPRPAYAVHGASMVGLNLFMVGAMIDGRGESDGLRAGPAALSLGALGALAGGWWGATQIHDEGQGKLFLAAPPVFGVAGMLLGGLSALAVPDSDTQFRRVLIGASGGIAVGLATSLAFRLTEGPSERRHARLRAPQLTADHDRVVFSVGGRFN